MHCNAERWKYKKDNTDWSSFTRVKRASNDDHVTPAQNRTFSCMPNSSTILSVLLTLSSTKIHKHKVPPQASISWLQSYLYCSQYHTMHVFYLSFLLTVSVFSNYHIRAVRVELQRHTIDVNIFPFAVCNDGTSASYYKNNFNGTPSEWICTRKRGLLCH